MTIRDDMTITLNKDVHVRTWITGLKTAGMNTNKKCIQILGSLLCFCHQYNTMVGQLSMSKVEIGYDEQVVINADGQDE